MENSAMDIVSDKAQNVSPDSTGNRTNDNHDRSSLNGLNNGTPNDISESDLMDVSDEVTDPVLDAAVHHQLHHPQSPSQPDSSTELERPGSKSDESIDGEKIAEDDDSRAEGTIRWTFPDVRKLAEVGQTSPAIQVRNLPWKIMVMKRKTRSSHQHEENWTLGYFLQCNADAESPSWTCSAQAKLKIIPFKPETTMMDRAINHMFYNKENDWGFTNFLAMDDLIDPGKGYINPADFSLQLEVNITADPPHGVCWDSKKYTGYIGLKNQGATCYMNSLLQALYFTNKLRRACYLIPTEADDPIKSVPLAVQRVFYELQSSDKPVGTKKLTKSFGWETLDSFMQHDAQELCRVLLDNIDMKMKGTRAEGTIPKLFEGKMVSFIRCKHVDYESSREESFMDVQLNVKDRKDVYESFDDYVAIEVLEGDNKYDAGVHGLQEAEKGIAFLSFPPVLHLQLKRFQFDPISENNIKINDKFEFPERLDLTKYINGSFATPPIYCLHAVLVHSGDNHGGHYVVYINPKGDGKWCKFDDDVVIRCKKEEAIAKNFGGSTEEYMQFRNCTNAYMLVYIAESMKEEILHLVTETDVPGYLNERLNEERDVEVRRRKEKIEQGLHANLRVVTEDDFTLHQGHELIDYEKVMAKKAFHVKKDATLAEFQQILADWTGHAKEDVIYWPWQLRPNNGSLRPTILQISEPTQLESHTVLELVSTYKSGGSEGDDNDLLLFLEIVPQRKKSSGLNGGHVLRKQQEDPCVLFFRQYDPVRRVLEYKGYDYYSPKMTAREVMEACNVKAGFPAGTQLLIFNDYKQNQLDRIPVEPVGPYGSRSNYEVVADMDCLIFQKLLSAEETEHYSLPTVKDFFRDLTFRTEVEFVDKEKQLEESFTLTLNLRMSYQLVVQAVAARLRTDPKRIQLFRNNTNAIREGVGAPIIPSSETTLKELLPRHPANNKKKLYYQYLDVDISELEFRKEIKLLWQPNFRDEGREISVTVNKNGTINDVLEALKKQIELSPDGSGRLRLLELTSSRINSIMNPASPVEQIATLSGNRVFRVEETPLDQVTLEPDESLLAVAHLHKEVHAAFGIPFFLKIKAGELVSDIKERIRKILDVPEKEFEKYKFCFCHMGKQTYIDDPDRRINLKDLIGHVHHTPSTAFLGIDHINKTPKRPRPSYLEKAVRIYN